MYRSESCRFYSPYVHCLLTQILMIHLFLRLPTCARLIKSNMSQPLGAGPKSMQWARYYICLLKVKEPQFSILADLKPTILSVIMPC
jgi:hypothetical protein